jgi:hypothetical protein
MALIRERQARYAATFEGTAWLPSQLSDVAYLAMVDVPWLLTQLEGNRHGQGHKADDDGKPGADGVGPTKAALQLVLPEQPVPVALCVVPASNPLAQFGKGFLAQAVGVLVAWHVAKLLMPRRKSKGEGRAA